MKAKQNKNEKKPYSIKRILSMRNDKHAFGWFIDTIIPCLLGMKYCLHYKYSQIPSKWISRSMEAFAIICYENYYRMVESDVNGESYQNKPVYTADGRGKPKNQGWSKEAIQRYNQLLDYAGLDRKINQLTEKEYLNVKKKKRKMLTK